MKKLVVLNVLILFALITALNVFAVIVYQFRLTFIENPNSNLEIYNNYDWADDYFKEQGELRLRYSSYVGWRQNEYQGLAINIDSRGLRATHRPESPNFDAPLDFFGGSTIWGTGVNDENTIPSWVAKLSPGSLVGNNGERGYVIRQEINFLLNRIDEGATFEKVVFYDGVNDVILLCRVDVLPHTHGQTDKMIRELDFDSPGRGRNALSIILPLYELAQSASRRIGAIPQEYDCDSNPEKANSVADYIMQEWEMVQAIVESKGFTFAVFLQPTAAVSNTNLDHLILTDSVSAQYRAVYPMIQALIQAKRRDGQPYFDISNVLDVDQDVYRDEVHLLPEGNRLVARRILEILRNELEWPL